MSKLTIALVAVAFLAALHLHGQEIALTFDDAPMGDGPLLVGARRTERIISELRKHNVPQAAFFVVTNQLDTAGLKRVQRYADAGHVIANHTHTHQWIKDIGCDRYIAGIGEAHRLLKSMKGFRPWFRYPFLDEGKTIPKRDSIRGALNDLQLRNGYVTVDNYDWYLNGLLRTAIRENSKINMDSMRSVYLDHIWSSIVFYDNIARKALNRSPKHVLLLHENDLAAHFIGDLVGLLRSRGWKIISPEEAYTDPIATYAPDVLFNGQGRIAAIAVEKGMKPAELVQDTEDEQFLDELVKRKRVFE
jgi:peptidoglycan-N-acetylglucosamine deacetylase